MRQKQNTILGISPGTRSTGYAIISDGELVDWGEKVTKGKWSKHQEAKVMEFIFRIVENYNVTRIVIKRTDPSHSSKNLENFYSRILSEKQKLIAPIELFTNKDLKSHYPWMLNRGMLIDEARKQFPELACDRFMCNISHIRVFEAVICAMTITLQ